MRRGAPVTPCAGQSGARVRENGQGTTLVAEKALAHPQSSELICWQEGRLRSAPTPDVSPGRFCCADLDARDGCNKVRCGGNGEPAVKFPSHTMAGEPLMASELEMTAAALEATQEIIRISKTELNGIKGRQKDAALEQGVQPASDLGKDVAQTDPLGKVPPHR